LIERDEYDIEDVLEEAGKELFRPWKLVALAFGLGFLYWGAFNLNCPDWSTGNSTIMATFTYLLAPSCARAVVKRRYAMWPAAAFCWWLCVDGLYVAWNELEGLPVFREANSYASSCLFWLCGFIWLPRASLSAIAKNPKTVPI
jgi:hypothetical protein